MDLFQEIYHSIQNGRELVVATVISDSGSTPRSSGSKMLVYSDGSISGTIGGGSIEGDVIERAKDLFNTQSALILSYNLNRTGKIDDMDVVCGGRMQILLEHIACNQSNLAMYGSICEEINSSQPFFWVGKISNGTGWQIDRALVSKNNTWLGTLEKDNDLTAALNGLYVKPAHTALLDHNKEHYVVELIKPPYAVYIMGAGHVSKEIALLAKQVGFKTLVFDDRAEYADRKRFPDADEVIVCNGFESVFDDFEIPPGNYIVIVTRGHRFDKEVLAQALRTDAAYIGMIGSRKKRESVYQALLEEGFSRTELDEVSCPIGLSIEAETPAEIGVSIVAELIEHRAKRNKHT